MSYTGPSITVHPNRHWSISVHSPSRPWVNPDNLLGAADGVRATTGEVNFTSSPNLDATDVRGFGYPVIMAAQSAGYGGGECEILTFQYTDRSVFGTSTPDGNYAAGLAALNRQPLNRSGATKGQTEGSHEMTASSAGAAADWGSEGDFPNPRYANSTTAFLLNYNECATLSDFTGLAINAGNANNSTHAYTINFSVDAITLTAFITPAPPGESRSIPIKSISKSNGAGLGLAVDVSYPDEIDYDSIANAQVVNGTYATATTTDGTNGSTTYFTILTLDKDCTRHLKLETLKELRIQTVGNFTSAKSGITTVSLANKAYATIDEAALLDSHNAVLSKLTTSDLYAQRTFQIADDQVDRSRTIVIDASGLTPSSSGIVSADPAIALRWRISNPLNGVPAVSASWALDGILRIFWVYARPPGRSNRTQRTNRIGRMGRRDN